MKRQLVTGGTARRRGASLAVACAGLIALAAGCGTQTASQTTPALQVTTAPLSTSLVTALGAWAITVMGGSAASENNFWQLFVRPAGVSRWSLAGTDLLAAWSEGG